MIALFAIVYAKPAEKHTHDSKKSAEDEPKSKSEPADKEKEETSDDDSKDKVEHSRLFEFFKDRASPILGAFQERAKARKEHEHESS